MNLNVIPKLLCFLAFGMLCHPLFGQNSYAEFGQNEVLGAGYSSPTCGCDSLDSGCDSSAAAGDNACLADCCEPCPKPCCTGAYTCSVGASSCAVYGTLDAMLLYRTNGSNSQPLAINVNSNETLRSTGDYSLGYEGGVRATIGLTKQSCFCCLPAYEFTYLGAWDWSSSLQVDGGPNSLSLPGDLGFGGVNGFTLAESIRTEYETELNSAETNYFGCIFERNWCNCYRRLEWLAGFRYLSLDENLGLLGHNVGVADASYTIDTDNDLYGAQLGSRMRTFRGYWGWEAIGKAGIYGNDSSQEQRIVDELGVNDFVVRNASASKGQTAFIGELGFSLLARLTTKVSARAGYNLLWIEGVALAPDQLDYTDTAQSGIVVDSGGGAFMHGFNFGLDFGW